MASISKHKQGIVVRWDRDDWLRGLINTFGAGVSSRFGDGLNLATSIDPFRRPGYLTPGYEPEDATNASEITAILKNGVANANDIYCIENGNLLHEMSNTLIPIVSNSGSWPHTIAPHGGHSAVVGEDVIAYYLDGTRYLFYSWNDNTDGDIGRFNFVNTFDDDYVSTVATTGAVLQNNPHPMIVGDDDILYIGDGRNVASLQGTTADGIFNPSALDLPDGYIITSFSKTATYLVVYAYFESDPAGVLSDPARSKCTAFFWDYSSDSFTLAPPLQGNRVNGGFILNGMPGCFVSGHNNDFKKQSKMMLYNGSTFQPIIAFDELIPGHGGVEVSNNLVTWNSAGTIFSYGNPFIGSNASLQKIARGDGFTANGMLGTFLDIEVATLLASSGTGTNGGLNVFRAGFNEGSQVYTGQKQLPISGRDKWRVDFVKVNYFATVDSGTIFRIGVVADDNGSADGPDEQRGLITYVYESGVTSAVIDQISKIYNTTSGISSTGDLPTVSTSLGVFMDWSDGSPSTVDAPSIESVEVYLLPVSLNTQ